MILARLFVFDDVGIDASDGKTETLWMSPSDIDKP
jgi:hypothetical protein